MKVIVSLWRFGDCDLGWLECCVILGAPLIVKEKSVIPCVGIHMPVATVKQSIERGCLWKMK